MINCDMPPPQEFHPDVMFSLRGMLVTRKMKQLAVETVYSIHTIATLKRLFNLTDFGLECVLELSSRKALSPFLVAEIIEKEAGH